MRYRLRTLLIVMAMLPPLLAIVWLRCPQITEFIWPLRDQSQIQAGDIVLELSDSP